MKLENRLALITGGGRGIGRAIALAFAAEGSDVVVAARSAKQVEDVANEIAASFETKSLAVTCDVSDSASVEQMFRQALEQFGRSPDILVNNAGVAESAPLLTNDDTMW